MNTKEQKQLLVEVTPPGEEYIDELLVSSDDTKEKVAEDKQDK
jgi:hypothetical protein